jgi:hypothetical protein
MFTGFGKNDLVLCKLLCWKFVIDLYFSEVYLQTTWKIVKIYRLDFGFENI